jgi:cytoskeleton protein RodZ
MTDELVVEVVAAMQNGTSSNDTSSNDTSLLGEVLLAARIAKGYSQKDASDNLRLSIKQIDALETNAFSLLPDAMITRGFIRNYARYLELDAEPLLLSYRARMPDKSPNVLSVQTSIQQVMLTKESQPWLKYILGSILVLLFLLSWFFYMDYMPKPAKHNAIVATDAAVNTASTEAIALPEVALPAAERQPEVSEVVVGTEPVNSASDSVAVTPVVSGTPVASTTAVASATPVVTNATTPSAPILPTAKMNSITNKADVAVQANSTINSAPLATTKNISLTCTEQTWVSVTNKAGKVIFEKMLSAGSSDSFDGEPPFNVVIGNAKASKLMYSGKSIDLNPSTRSNVARITLQ